MTSPMIPAPVDYATARTRFLETARAAGGTIDSHVHPHRSPGDDELASDVARFGAAVGEAETVVLISSGLHGIEGHAGSGLQHLLLESGEIERFVTADPTNAVVLIHAVNPFGFAWSRRVDHDNIDVNRNFVDYDHLPVNSGYERLSNLLNPTDADFDPADHSVLAEFAGVVEELGMDEVFRSVSGGQYTHPDGVQFGGTGPSWSRTMLETVWEAQLPGASRAIVLDIHTGLGPNGHLTVFTTADAGSPADRGGTAWFPTSLYRSDRADEALANTGLMGVGFDDWVATRFGGTVQSAAYVLEFGTLDPLHGALVFRADNWLAHHALTDDDRAPTIRSMMLDFFYLDTPEWRSAVATDGLASIQAVLDAPLAMDTPA